MNNPRIYRNRAGGLALMAVSAFVLFGLLSGVANAKDRNGDRIPDRWEKHHHLSLKVNQARRDQDQDHLRNRAEFLADDNPRDADTDDDGVMDGEEKAGTIVSFDAATGKLVIDLFGTDTISGTVGEQTEIECEDEHLGATASEDGSEPNDGPGDGETADDEREGAQEPADDSSGSNSGEDSGPGDQEDNGGNNCTTADLVPGAVVREAELKVENGGAAFEEIELAR